MCRTISNEFLLIKPWRVAAHGSMDVPFENVVSLTFGSVVPGAGGNTLLECTVKYSNGVEEALCVHSDVAFYGDGRTLPGPYSSVQPTLLKTILFASPASVGVNAAKVP